MPPTDTPQSKASGKSSATPLSVAIIDLGTNALRFELYSIISSPENPSGYLPTRIRAERFVVRLGSRVYQTGKLNAQAKPIVNDIFRQISIDLASIPNVLVKAVATSAFRVAADAAEYLEELKSISGITIQIISGQKEAELIASGVTAYEPVLESPCMLIDIGGGSTELSLCLNRQIQASASLPLGAIRCHEEFLHRSPPSPESIKALREKILEQLKALPEKFTSLQAKELVGSSGTARTISELFGEQVVLSSSALLEMCSRILPLSLDEIQKLPGMTEPRADVIAAGILVLNTTADFFQIKNIRISKYSLRHGLLNLAIQEQLARR